MQVEHHWGWTLIAVGVGVLLCLLLVLYLKLRSAGEGADYARVSTREGQELGVQVGYLVLPPITPYTSPLCIIPVHIVRIALFRAVGPGLLVVSTLLAPQVFGEMDPEMDDEYGEAQPNPNQTIHFLPRTLTLRDLSCN